MNGKEIMNSFKRETIYEFSEAIPVFSGDLYIIFKVAFISIENPSKDKTSKRRKADANKTFISYFDAEPIAYLLKRETENNGFKYDIEPINEKYDLFVEKNKNKLKEDFLKSTT